MTSATPITPPVIHCGSVITRPWRPNRHTYCPALQAHPGEVDIVLPADTYERR